MHLASVYGAPAGGAQQLLRATVPQHPGVLRGLQVWGYEKSHPGCKSNTAWGGSIPFLTLKDTHIHWFGIYLPRSPRGWGDLSGNWYLFLAGKSLFSKPLTCNLEPSLSLDQTWECQVQRSTLILGWVISKKLWPALSNCPMGDSAKWYSLALV